MNYKPGRRRPSIAVNHDWPVTTPGMPILTAVIGGLNSESRSLENSVL